MNITLRFLLLAACLVAGPLFADNRLYTHTPTSTVAVDDKVYLDGPTLGTRALSPDWWATQDLSFNFTGNLTSVIGLRGHALPSLSAGFLRYNGSAWVFDSATYITNPLTTLGDVFVGGSSGIPARLGQGANGTFLGVQGGVLGYYTPGGGGNVSNSGTPTSGQAAEWTSATVIQGVAITGTGSYVKATGATLTNPLIAALANLTSNGFVTTAGGVGTLGVSTAGANVLTALGVDVGNAGAVVVNGGVLGTPLSGIVTNLTGTASININGTVGAGTPNTGAFTTGVFGSTGSITLGTAGSTVGQLLFKNATSGTLTVAPPTGALGTYAVTLPNAASTLPVFGQQITFLGPTAARSITLPDANFTVARIDNANTFTGASSTSGWIMTAPTITTGITPTVNDGAALGSTALQFSDLFLASGAVINYANGDVLLTHSSGLLTLGVGDLRITNAGTNAASVVTAGGTQTLSTKRVNPRVVTVSDAASWTPGGDTSDVSYQLNTQGAGTLTVNAPSGTPVPGQRLMLKIKSTNAQTYAFNAIYVSGSDVTLPTASTAGKIDDIGFIYDEVNSKWQCVAVAKGY